MYYMFRDNKQALNDIAIKMYLKSIEEDGLDDVILLLQEKGVLIVLWKLIKQFKTN